METSDAIPDGGEVRFKVAGGGEACVGRGGRVEKRMERTDVFYETESELFLPINKEKPLSNCLGNLQK